MYWGEGRVSCMERVPWKLTLPYVTQIASGNLCMSQETQTGALYHHRGVGWGGRWEGGSKGGHICITMTDSYSGLTENNKILSSNYPSIKMH